MAASLSTSDSDASGRLPGAGREWWPRLWLQAAAAARASRLSRRSPGRARYPTRSPNLGWCPGRAEHGLASGNGWSGIITASSEPTA